MIAYLLYWTMVATARATPVIGHGRRNMVPFVCLVLTGQLITTNTIPRYKGIGSAKGLGKLTIPFCVALDESALAQGDRTSDVNGVS